MSHENEMNRENETNHENETALPMEVSVESVKQLLSSEQDLFLVDCREPVEFELAAIEGATLIPMRETPNRIEEIKSQVRPVVVFCHHGARSFQVVQYLRNQGIQQAQSMHGGIDAWSQQIDPSVPRY